jgi:hypothetical protein
MLLHKKNMDAKIKQLCDAFPQIDRLVAETILILHERGELNQYTSKWQEEGEPSYAISATEETVLQTVHVD